MGPGVNSEHRSAPPSRRILLAPGSARLVSLEQKGGPMSAKSLVLTAGVALVVVLAYEQYKGGKRPSLRRAA